jgi:hypothetical protein
MNGNIKNKLGSKSLPDDRIRTGGKNMASDVMA